MDLFAYHVSSSPSHSAFFHQKVCQTKAAVRFLPSRKNHPSRLNFPILTKSTSRCPMWTLPAISALMLFHYLSLLQPRPTRLYQTAQRIKRHVIVSRTKRTRSTDCTLSTARSKQILEVMGPPDLGTYAASTSAYSLSTPPSTHPNLSYPAPAAQKSHFQCSSQYPLFS